MTDTRKTSSLTTPGDPNNVWKSDIGKPGLTDDELKPAVGALNNTNFTDLFPKLDRNYADPPIITQQIGLISFIPAKGATPNKDGIFGFAKLRGNYGTEDEASTRAEQLIRDVDSTHTIFHTYVGRPFPITESEKFSANNTEIDIRKHTTESVSESIKQKKNEDKLHSQQIFDREKELFDDVAGDKPAEVIEEDEYITLSVKKAQLSWTYLEHVNKLKDIKAILTKTKKQLDEADVKDPTLKVSFFQKYVDARKKAGLANNEKEFKSSFVQYLVEDAVLPGIDIEDDLVDTVLDSVVEDLDNMNICTSADSQKSA